MSRRSYRPNLNVVDVVDAVGGHIAPGRQCSRPRSSPEHAPVLIVNIADTTTAVTRTRRRVEREAIRIGCPMLRSTGRARRSAVLYRCVRAEGTNPHRGLMARARHP